MKKNLFFFILLAAAAGIIFAQTDEGFLLLKTDDAVYYYKNADRLKEVSAAVTDGLKFIKMNFYDAKIPKFTIYIYNTQEELANGLIRYSNFSANTAFSFSKSGAPRPIDYKLHVSPQFKEQSIVHELTHTFIEKMSNTAYLRIKWLDEGIAEYISYLYIKSIFSKEAAEKKKNDLIRYFNDQKYTFINLKDICSEEQWSKNRTGGNAALVYREAFYVVMFLDKKYGMDKLKNVLIEIDKGKNIDKTLIKILNINQEQIYNELRNLEKIDDLL